MIVGICDPNGEAPVLLRELAPWFHSVRFDITYGVDSADAARDRIARVKDCGFLPHAILGLNYGGALPETDSEFGRLGQWAARTVVDNRIVRAELLNEPHRMGKIPASVARRAAVAMATAISDAAPGCRLIWPGETLKPNRKGCRPCGYWDEMVQGVDWRLVSSIGEHPYRNPGEPWRAYIGGRGWLWFRTAGTRKAEWDYVREQARGREIDETEVGWNLSELPGTPQQREGWQAQWCVEELNIAERNGIKSVYFYAHVGRADQPQDWGFFEDTDHGWRPRPVVEAVRQWVEVRSR